MIKKIKINNLIYTSYFLLLAASMFSNIIILKSINNIFKYLSLFIMLICLIIQMKKIEKKQIIFIITAFMVFFISFINCKDYSLVFFFFLMLSTNQIYFN